MKFLLCLKYRTLMHFYVDEMTRPLDVEKYIQKHMDSICWYPQADSSRSSLSSAGLRNFEKIKTIILFFTFIMNNQHFQKFSKLSLYNKIS